MVWWRIRRFFLLLFLLSFLLIYFTNDWFKRIICSLLLGRVWFSLFAEASEKKLIGSGRTETRAAYKLVYNRLCRTDARLFKINEIKTIYFVCLGGNNCGTWIENLISGIERIGACGYWSSSFSSASWMVSLLKSFHFTCKFYKYFIWFKRIILIFYLCIKQDSLRWSKCLLQVQINAHYFTLFYICFISIFLIYFYSKCL